MPTLAARALAILRARRKEAAAGYGLHEQADGNARQQAFLISVPDVTYGAANALLHHFRGKPFGSLVRATPAQLETPCNAVSLSMARRIVAFFQKTLKDCADAED